MALAGLLRLAESDDPLDEDSAAAAGALLLEEARLVAHRGGDPEAIVRQAIDRLGARVAALEAAAGGAVTDLGALDSARRLELWRASAAD